MSDGGQQFILKFFSGPHAGAEVLLPPGEYTLGGAESCDIVIHDEAVAARHARLRIAATAMWLTPLDRAVTVAGSPIEGETAVAFRQIATLGTTHFGVAPTGETWDSVILPDLPQVGAARMREEAAAAESAVPSLPAGSTGIPKPAPVERPTWRSRQLAPLGGIAIIVCGLSIMSLYGHIRPTAASIPESSIRSPGVDGQIKNLLAELEIDQLQLTRTEQGDWQLGGHVADAEQKRRLVAALRERGLRVRLQVWSPDELLESARVVLSGMSLPLAVSYAGPGVLTLSGDAPDHQSVARAAENLQRDIPGLRKLDNRVAVAARASAGRPITPAPSAGAPRAAPQLAIRSVSLGSVRFVVTADGAKYLEGASLANGFVLKAIREDGLVLSNGDQDIIYHFGRG